MVNTHVHPIDIIPHDVKRDVGGLVALDDLSRLGDVVVSPSALMLTQGPGLHHGGLASDVGVLLDGRNGARARDKVKVEGASEDQEEEKVKVQRYVSSVSALRGEEDRRNDAMPTREYGSQAHPVEARSDKHKRESDRLSTEDSCIPVDTAISDRTYNDVHALG